MAQGLKHRKTRVLEESRMEFGGGGGALLAALWHFQDCFWSTLGPIWGPFLLIRFCFTIAWRICVVLRLWFESARAKLFLFNVFEHASCSHAKTGAWK